MRPLLMVLIALIGGCGEPPVQLHPVRGTVTRAGKPANGGTVQFVHETQANVRAVGEIGADGTFTLVTLANNSKRTGAVAGSYKAIFVFKASDPPVQHDTVYVVEPRDNTFTIALP